MKKLIVTGGQVVKALAPFENTHHPERDKWIGITLAELLWLEKNGARKGREALGGEDWAARHLKNPAVVASMNEHYERCEKYGGLPPGFWPERSWRDVDERTVREVPF